MPKKLLPLLPLLLLQPVLSEFWPIMLKKLLPLLPQAI